MRRLHALGPLLVMVLLCLPLTAGRASVAVCNSQPQNPQAQDSWCSGGTVASQSGQPGSRSNVVASALNTENCAAGQSGACGRLRVGAQSVRVEAFGLCRYLDNNNASEYFIPAGSLTDWQAFINNAPAGVVRDTCVPQQITGTPLTANGVSYDVSAGQVSFTASDGTRAVYLLGEGRVFTPTASAQNNQLTITHSFTMSGRQDCRQHFNNYTCRDVEPWVETYSVTVQATANGWQVVAATGATPPAFNPPDYIGAQSCAPNPPLDPSPRAHGAIWEDRTATPGTGSCPTNYTGSITWTNALYTEMRCDNGVRTPTGATRSVEENRSENCTLVQQSCTTRKSFALLRENIGSWSDDGPDHFYGEFYEYEIRPDGNRLYAVWQTRGGYIETDYVTYDRSQIDETDRLIGHFSATSYTESFVSAGVGTCQGGGGDDYACPAVPGYMVVEYGDCGETLPRSCGSNHGRTDSIVTLWDSFATPGTFCSAGVAQASSGGINFTNNTFTWQCVNGIPGSDGLGVPPAAGTAIPQQVSVTCQANWLCSNEANSVYFGCPVCGNLARGEAACLYGDTQVILGTEQIACTGNWDTATATGPDGAPNSLGWQRCLGTIPHGGSNYFGTRYACRRTSNGQQTECGSNSPVQTISWCNQGTNYEAEYAITNSTLFFRYSNGGQPGCS